MKDKAKEKAKEKVREDRAAKTKWTLLEDLRKADTLVRRRERVVETHRRRLAKHEGDLAQAIEARRVLALKVAGEVELVSGAGNEP